MSWTVNILIRILLYLAQSYHEYFEQTSQSLYKSKKVKMPKPELYVIYTGNKGRKPDTISLSQEFFDGADIDIEIKAKVIYESGKDNIINELMTPDELAVMDGGKFFISKKNKRLRKEKNPDREIYRFRTAKLLK